MVDWQHVSVSSSEVIISIANTAFMTLLYYFLVLRPASSSTGSNKHRENTADAGMPPVPQQRPFPKGKNANSVYRNISEQLGFEDIDDNRYLVTTAQKLRELVPDGAMHNVVENDGKPVTSWTNVHKAVRRIDDQMRDFVEASPLVFLATLSSPEQSPTQLYDGTKACEKTPFCSAKGGSPGFCKVHKSEQHNREQNHDDDDDDDDNTSTKNKSSSDKQPVDEIWIPEDPGNQLPIALQNILENNNISLCFVVPKVRVTLRIVGQAILTTNPRVLYSVHDSSANNGTSEPFANKVAIRIKVEQAFFHGGESLTKSKVWDTTTWPKKEHKVDLDSY